VRKIVDRGAAGVHANFAGSLRDEGFEFSAQRVVEKDFRHLVSAVSGRVRASREL